MKAVVRYSGLLTVLTLVVSLGLAGVTPAVAQVAQEGIVACVPTVWQLTAGQTIPVGSVIVDNDRNNISVTYNLSNEAPNACFGNLHLWGGTDLANVPKNNAGNPVPGQFPYQFDASGERTHTFTIPIGDLLVPACDAGLSLYIVSHAEVDLECTPETAEEEQEHETAFGGSLPGVSGERWWLYGHYTLCCPRPPVTEPPPSGCTEETAWGGSIPGNGPAWWYYYENALVNQDMPVDTQPIYAGQNLTNGTVTCDAGSGNLSINLGSWSLRDVPEEPPQPVKVQCYQNGQVPPSRPSAGLFTTYKGTELTVPNFDCNSCTQIAIHLDVEQCPVPTVP